MGKRLRPATIALLASASLVLFAAVGIDGAPPDESTTSDEELVEPEWRATSEDVQDVSKFGNDACLGWCGAELRFHNDPEANHLDEYHALLESLSPGVRARYLRALRQRADAQKKQRERDEAVRGVY